MNKEIFKLSSHDALDAVLRGKIVKDSEDGYFFRYPSKDEIEHHFCSSSELIRSKKMI